MTRAAARMPSPVGPLALVEDDGVLVRLGFLDAADRRTRALPFREGACAASRAQLEEYFAGERRAFDVPLRLEGGAFQLRVWEALRAIPYGRTLGYGELAASLGLPDAARAVGQANHVNPIAIVVPCHRVVGADGELVGFGGGKAVQRALLDLERGQRTFA